MKELDRAQNDLEAVIKRRLKINPGLETVERHPEYAKMIEAFHKAMIEQVHELLASDLFKDIDAAIGSHKADGSPIPTESDDLEIQDAVNDNIVPLSKKIGQALADFFIIVFNMGGQDFLNKHNIPATFELENERIVEAVKSAASTAITGIDQTTADWITGKISSGRADGLSNADIADSIRSQVPDTYANRAEAIVRTETSNMVGQSENITAVNNGASHKEWVVVDDGNVCPICEGNESAGQIGIAESFPSGDSQEPAHPNCRCIVEYHFTPFMGTIWSGQ